MKEESVGKGLELAVIEWWNCEECKSTWQDKEKQLFPVKVKTIGFVTETHRNYVTVAQTVCKDMCFCKITIPRCSIKSVRYFTKFIASCLYDGDFDYEELGGITNGTRPVNRRMACKP